MNTFIRLAILLPATIFAFLMAWVGVGFAGFNVWALVIALTFVGTPAALLVWTIRDHYRRRSLADYMRAQS